MKFENLLSRRYIIAQKRHSLLTVCSIVIALALMTMLFTCFTTLNSIQRACIYDATPYHLEFISVNGVQANALSQMNEVESSVTTENPDGTFKVRLMLNKYIDNEEEYVLNALVQLHIAPASLMKDSYWDTKIFEYVNINFALLAKDLLTLNGRYALTQMLALFFVLIVTLAIALRLVIDTAFEVSSKERERQLGVLQSIGATPKQIVRIITHEGLTLSAVGIPIGSALGIVLGYAAYRAVLASGVADVFLTKEKADQLVHFHVNPWMTLAAMVVGLVWVWLSAYGTGMRIIRKSPIEAISARSNTIKKVRKHSLFGLVFGWTGKLASRNARRQPKRFIVTVLSLTISIALFAGFNMAMDSIAEEVEMEWTENDCFGPTRFDLDLYLNINAETGLCDPLAYRDAAKLLTDSGLFIDVEHLNLHDAYAGTYEPGDPYVYWIGYITEATYRRIFAEQEPPVSYEELNRSGGALMLYDPEAGDELQNTAEISCLVRKQQRISSETYDKLKAEQDAGDTSIVIRRIPGVDEEEYHIPERCAQTTFAPVTYRITARSEYSPYVKNYFQRAEMDVPKAILVLTDDCFAEGDWENFGDYVLGDDILCRVKDDASYEEGKRFLAAHTDTFEPLEEWFDMYGQRKRVETILASVRIIVNFVNIMIALIAIVNMVNIISTGILNRKSELAAMQCVGMTRGQMYRMTAIECLQYVFGSGVGASLLCAVVIYATQAMLFAVELADDLGNKFATYTEPLPRIWITAGLAYLIALITSMLPLHRMQKEPLVEQIRSVE